MKVGAKMEFGEKIYTINEVSEKLDLNNSTLRNWEQEFDLKVPRNNRNHRYYTEKEIEVLEIIKDGRDKNHSIETIKKAFLKHGVIEEQQEHGMKLMKLDQLTVEELQDAMFSRFKEVVAETVIEREKKLKSDFEEMLMEREEQLTEKISNKIRDQMEAENQKLMNHITATREKEKKGFLSKIFGK